MERPVPRLPRGANTCEQGRVGNFYAFFTTAVSTAIAAFEQADIDLHAQHIQRIAFFLECRIMVVSFHHIQEVEELHDALFIRGGSSGKVTGRRTLFFVALKLLCFCLDVLGDQIVVVAAFQVVRAFPPGIFYGGCQRGDLLPASGILEEVAEGPFYLLFDLCLYQVQAFK